jgi:hypothetical protein
MIGINNLGMNGRLGNQMFQYAALVGIAKNLNYEYTIPNRKSDLTDCFLLDSCVNRGFVDGDEVILHESHEFCEDLFRECPDGITLNGYFQSEKYFNNITDTIKKDFTFKEGIAQSVLSTYANLSEYVSIVVRRYEDDFDYVGCSNNHRNLPIEYYEESMRVLGNDRKYIVCSNNVDWCKEQKAFSTENVIINDINAENKGLFDLCLISNCGDFIIANSTFAWWGAWLGNNKNKKILSPKKWYGDGLSHIKTTDLFPKNWILIDK